MRLVKKYPIINILHHTAFSYPSPSNLSYLWNFGSLALLCLVIQILSGIFLAMHYVSYDLVAFSSVEHIMRDVNSGWMLRYLHANGASMFFIVVYTHVFRGLYYSSYAPPREILWIVGVLILLIMILTAFMGYVLPWGQMSFWAATVITNLASAIPYGIGNAIVLWLWGGFAVAGATLTRFYSFHYLFPFILIALSFLHIVLLHENGSNNPLGLGFRTDYVNFGPYYIVKDLFGVFVFLLLYINFAFFFPNYLGHTDNYIMANSLVTPAHIVPEWYFLPFYAILRSVPDKLMGVLLLLGSIFILMLLPFYTKIYVRSAAFKPFFKIGFWFFVIDCFFLGWLGGKAIETPFLELGKGATIFYFVYFLVMLPLFTFIENFVWFPYKKIGALTSKPSAFRMRSWEVKNIDTIDCLDSTCVPIIVGVKNLNLQRVLPKLNNEFNVEWISDRTRFVYDSLKRRVLFNPLLLNKKYNCYNIVSINYAYKHVLGYMRRFTPQIYTFFGNIIDLESIFLIKKFVRQYSYNNPIFINNNKIENWGIHNSQRAFFISNIISQNLLRKKIFFLGIDIRYDIPILNIEIRKLKHNNIYLVGPKNYNINYKFKHLGLFLKKKLIKNNIINNQYSNNLMLLGNDYLKSNDTLPFLQNLQKSSNVTFISDKNAFINIHEVGSTTKRKKNEYINTQINYNLYYLLNLENLNNYSLFKGDRNITVYQGSFFNNFNSLYKKIYCIIPVCSFFEENQYFINCFGSLKKTKKCVKKKNNILKNSKNILLKMNFYIKNKNLEYSTYYKIFYQYNEYLLREKLNTILLVFFEFSKKHILYKKTIIKNQNNFFSRTTISRNSLFCLLGQKNILKKKYYV